MIKDKKLWEKARKNVLKKGVIAKEYYCRVKEEYKRLKNDKR